MGQDLFAVTTAYLEWDRSTKKYRRSNLRFLNIGLKVSIQCMDVPSYFSGLSFEFRTPAVTWSKAFRQMMWQQLWCKSWQSSYIGALVYWWCWQEYGRQYVARDIFCYSNRDLSRDKLFRILSRPAHKYDALCRKNAWLESPYWWAGRKIFTLRNDRLAGWISSPLTHFCQVGVHFTEKSSG